MSFKEDITKYLEREPRFRERKNKDRGIINLILKRYPTLKMAPESCFITKEVLVAIVQDYASLDRWWRKVLEVREDLRGSDYDEKDNLEADHMENLGYNRPTHIGPGEALEENKQPELL